MFSALSLAFGTTIAAADVTDEAGFVCPVCKDRVYLRRGSFAPHFAHYENRGCTEPVWSPWHDAAEGLLRKAEPERAFKKHVNGANGAAWLQEDIGSAYHFIDRPLKPNERFIFSHGADPQNAYPIIRVDEIRESQTVFRVPNKLASAFDPGDHVYFCDGWTMVYGPVGYVALENKRVGRLHPILGIPYVQQSGFDPSLLMLTEIKGLVSYGERYDYF